MLCVAAPCLCCRAWAGCLPTPQGRPCSSLTRRVSAAGHEGSGLTLGPATAALIAAHVTGRGAELPAWASALLPRLSLG